MPAGRPLQGGRATLAAARLDVHLTSRFLSKRAIRGLQSDAADPTRQRLKPRGCLQFCALGVLTAIAKHHGEPWNQIRASCGAQPKDADAARATLAEQGLIRVDESTHFGPDGRVSRAQRWILTEAGEHAARLKGACIPIRSAA